MRYASPDNFVGAPIDGYEKARCLLTVPAAEALALVQEDLAAQGYGLRVFDCYRPQRAVDHFVRWSRDPTDTRTRDRYYPGMEKSELLENGYIATLSGHSRGSTVDLTVVVLDDEGPGTPLDMGTPFDFFDPRSNTESPEITPLQLENRLRLRDAMAARGFENFPLEWWHYTIQFEPYPDDYWDVPVR
jgi:D-alanyl-D-alanine dipeptidase